MRALRILFPPLLVWGLGALSFLIGSSLEKTPALEGREDASQGVVEETSQEDEKIAFNLPVALTYERAIRAVSERPLFSETRRFQRPKIVIDPPEPADMEPEFVEPVIVEVPPPPEPPKLEFLGFVRNGNHFEALVSSPVTGTEQWLSVGEHFLDWSVVEISHNSVHFTRNGIEHVVEINQ